jgi:hypothetical protein
MYVKGRAVYVKPASSLPNRTVSGEAIHRLADGAEMMPAAPAIVTDETRDTPKHREDEENDN